MPINLFAAGVTFGVAIMCTLLGHWGPAAINLALTAFNLAIYGASKR